MPGFSVTAGFVSNENNRVLIYYNGFNTQVMIINQSKYANVKTRNLSPYFILVCEFKVIYRIRSLNHGISS